MNRIACVTTVTPRATGYFSLFSNSCTDLSFRSCTGKAAFLQLTSIERALCSPLHARFSSVTLCTDFCRSCCSPQPFSSASPTRESLRLHTLTQPFSLPINSAFASLAVFSLQRSRFLSPHRSGELTVSLVRNRFHYTASRFSRGFAFLSSSRNPVSSASRFSLDFALLAVVAK